MINSAPLLEGLQQLADEELQERLWLKGDPTAMSSFTEAMSYTFDDSGVGRAIESGYLQKTYSNSLVQKMEELRKLLHQVPENHPPDEIIRHPKMQSVRALAKELLRMLISETDASPGK